MAVFKARSSFIGLVSRGMFWSLLRPWRVEIDTDNRRIDIKRRNWHLISVDEDSFQFSSVRHVKIDSGVFAADLYIQMFAGTATVKAISKRNAKQIRDMLLTHAKDSKEGEIYIDTAPL